MLKESNRLDRQIKNSTGKLEQDMPHVKNDRFCIYLPPVLFDFLPHALLLTEFSSTCQALRLEVLEDLGFPIMARTCWIGA